MPRGGRRTGAGRPKGYRLPKTLEKEAAREMTRQMITQHLQPLIEAQVANAMGIKYLVTRHKKTGKFIRVTEAMAKHKLAQDEEIVEVWEKDPSTPAFTDLMNRAVDKPKDQVQEIKIVTVDERIARLERARTRLPESQNV